MSAESLAAPALSAWPLRRRQLWQVVRMEIARTFSSWRSLFMLLPAFAPALIIGAHGLEASRCRLDEETMILAFIVQVYYARFGVFFGCLAVFMRLLRGEMAERTLHYLFLAPVRREVVVAGKFVAGTLITTLVLGSAVLTSFILMYAHFPGGMEFVQDGPGLQHLGSYLLVTVLACIGYGAVFLAMSMVFKNPVVPAVVLLVWEGINGALPSWLKHLSVTFYLKPLFPVELPVAGISGLFTVVAEPTPAWAAISGLLVFAAAVLAYACWRVRRLEISYSTD